MVASAFYRASHAGSLTRRFSTLTLQTLCLRQPLAPRLASNYRGMLTVLVDGRPNAGDPREVPLTQFENIVLELGLPPAVPPASLYDLSTLRR